MASRMLRVAASACLVVAMSAQGGFLASKTFFVKNNSAAGLTCSISTTGAVWNDWFALAPGTEWSEKSNDRKRLIRCRAPVAAAFPILPGERYSFLRTHPGAPVTLKRIATEK